VVKTAKRALSFMTAKEQVFFFLFLSLRALVALFDLVGILAIGFLATSIALFLTQGSDPNRTIEIGNFSLEAINAQTLPFVAVSILILFLLKAVFSILLTRQLANFLAKIEARAARVIAESAFGQGLEGARNFSRDEIVFAVQIGSPSAFKGIMNSIGTLVAEGFLFILILASFILVDPITAAASILYFALIGFLIQYFLGGLMQKTGKRIAQSTVEANEALSDLGDVLREVAILGRQDFFYDKIYNSRLRTAGNSATQWVLLGMPRYIVETALIVGIAILVLIQTLSGDIASSAATLGIFLSGGLRLTASLLPLQSALLAIRSSIPNANKALDFLSGHHEAKSAVHLAEFRNDEEGPPAIQVVDVSFKYESSSEYALRNITLSIPRGAQAAIIGASGAGKSTLADIFLGLLAPTAGEVRVGRFTANEVMKFSPGTLGYVPQKPGMISGTIEENIALGINPENIDHAGLKMAISNAYLSTFVGSLPNGVNTHIGKRKDELSGGQLQRIGLARALYTQPKLLIMDEATSALDAESENEIIKALDDMRGRVTVVLIAHRLNTVQRSDVVFLMEEGKITASGTFPELLRTNSTVQKLAELMSIETDSSK
jgi:ABC-type multidrug transport system fused ATPase/permease subunit